MWDYCWAFNENKWYTNDFHFFPFFHHHLPPLPPPLTSFRTNVDYHLTPLCTPFVPESVQHLSNVHSFIPIHFFFHSPRWILHSMWVRTLFTLCRSAAVLTSEHTYFYIYMYFLCYNDEISKRITRIWHSHEAAKWKENKIRRNAGREEIYLGWGYISYLYIWMDRLVYTKWIKSIQ